MEFVKVWYSTCAIARRLDLIKDLEKLGCRTLRLDVTDIKTINEAVNLNTVQFVFW